MRSRWCPILPRSVYQPRYRHTGRDGLSEVCTFLTVPPCDGGTTRRRTGREAREPPVDSVRCDSPSPFCFPGSQGHTGWRIRGLEEGRRPAQRRGCDRGRPRRAAQRLEPSETFSRLRRALSSFRCTDDAGGTSLCSNRGRKAQGVKTALTAKMVPSSFALPSLDTEYLLRWYLAAFVLSGYIIYYICEVAKVPELLCAPGEFRTFLEKNVPILKEKFWPTFWCIESRAQTVLANIFRERLVQQVLYRRELFDLPDGGQVALDWLEDGCASNAPILLILPGLTGSSQAEYIRCLVKAVNRCGFRTVVFNNRGLGGVELKTPRLYNACNGDDLGEVLKHLKANNPNVPLAATGISMGGLVLGNYIWRRGKSVRSQLVAAMLISVPWNLFKGNESIEKPGLNMMLNKHLADLLCQTLKRQSHLDWGNLDETFKSRTIREFDSKFTCKAFGYSDTNEYYTDATLHDKLHQFQIPTLCLSAADDPFQPLNAIPLDDFKKCKNVAAVVTARGGHIGFMEGILPPSYQGKDDYMDRIVCQYFSAVFKDGGEIMNKLDS